MADVKTKQNQVLKLESGLNLAYAKFMVKMETAQRLAIYRKIQALLRNRFSLMDAMERMYQIVSKNGKNKSEPFAIAMVYWMHSIQNGEPFSVALRGWAPPTELLMLSVGDVANLEIALENTVKVVVGMQDMKRPVVSALGYPVFLMFMVVLLIWAVSKFMVPPMADAVPGIVWKGSGGALVALSKFVDQHPILLFSSLPIIILLIWMTMPRWKGKIRSKFDAYPPWSIYRTMIGVGWMLSLSALVEAGTPVSKALRALRQDASPYLLYRIDRALTYINNGDNLGEALYNTNLNFPDEEVVGDLRIYSELDNFSEALSNLSNDWLKDSILNIEQKAAVLNTVAILFIAGLVAWVVMGTFSMQEQMVSGMGVGG